MIESRQELPSFSAVHAEAIINWIDPWSTYHGAIRQTKEGQMAVHSNTFGGLQLSGEDAKKFRSQVSLGRTSQAAKASASKGIASAKTLLENGYVKVAKQSG